MRLLSQHDVDAALHVGASFLKFENSLKSDKTSEGTVVRNSRAGIQRGNKNNRGETFQRERERESESMDAVNRRERSSCPRRVRLTAQCMFAAAGSFPLPCSQRRTFTPPEMTQVTLYGNPLAVQMISFTRAAIRAPSCFATLLHRSSYQLLYR
jgi:hypothetical protein